MGGAVAVVEVVFVRLVIIRSTGNLRSIGQPRRNARHSSHAHSRSPIRNPEGIGKKTKNKNRNKILYKEKKKERTETKTFQLNRIG